MNHFEAYISDIISMNTINMDTIIRSFILLTIKEQVQRLYEDWKQLCVMESVQKRGTMEYRFTVENFETEVLNADIPVLVDFYADWCNPCKMMAPVVAKLAVELEGKCKVGKCNVEESMAIAQKYRVTNIPNFIVFKNGQPIANFLGAMSASELRSKVEEAIG